MVPGTGLEPVRCHHRGIFLPTTTFAATLLLIYCLNNKQKCVWGLDPVFAFKLTCNLVRQEPYGLYTFSTLQLLIYIDIELSLARRCHVKGFTELDSIHLKISL